MILRRWPRFTALILAATMSACVTAGDSGATPLNRQQKLYVQTREHIARGQWAQVRENMPALQHYALYPYIELAVLSDRLGALPSAEVDDFLQRYPDSVMADQLTGQWLATLARTGTWTDYLKYYRPETAGRTQQCWHAEALQQTGKPELALAETAKLWLTAEAPEACDAPFQRWLDSAQRDESMVWKRLMLALEQKQEQLARALAVEIREPYKLQAQYALLLSRDPAALNNLLPQLLQQPEASGTIAFGLKNLARRAPEMAAAIWRQTIDAKQLLAADSFAARNEIGRQLIAARGADAMPWLLQNDPRGEDGYLLEWRIRLSLRGGDWPQLAQWIEQLPADMAQSQRWQYWRARALAEIAGDGTKPKQAAELFAQLAKERSYYGFLSADRLRIPYAFNNRPVQPATSASAIARRADIERAHEFYTLNDKMCASREWQRALRNMSTDEQQAAAQLAENWGWHSQSIRSALQSGASDDLQLRFPLAYREPMSGAAKNNALPTDWLYAIARQESAFMPDAKSPVGALGLLQLMPDTAKQIARKMKLRIDQKQLLQPSPSIRLGSIYLRDLLRQFDGNRVLATAAYNAGPRRINTVLRDQPGPVSADVWVETFPYRETREYMQNVLAFAVIYAHRLGINSALLANDETRIGHGELQVTRADPKPADLH